MVPKTNREVMANKHHMLSNSILAILAMFVIFAAGCSSKPSAESIAKGKALAYTRCTACHDAATFEEQNYSRGEWESVIKKMMEHGAQYSSEEQAQIADFLSDKYGPK